MPGCPSNRKWTMTVIDALGLGLFAVNGTAKALAYGSVVIGVVKYRSTAHCRSSGLNM